MRLSEKGIILQAVRYGDKKFILRVFTRQHGVISAAVNVSSKPGSKIRRALIEPLTLTEIQLSSRANREVQQVSELSCYQQHPNIKTSPVRLAIAQFLNELCIKLIKEQSANTQLYDFLESCLNYLDQSENPVNLHLYFMNGLSRFTGIEPHNNYSVDQPYFDCREGQFTQMELAYPLGLNEAESKLFSDSLSKNILEEKISNSQRRMLLSAWIAYFQMHVPGFGELKSTAVLSEIL